RDRRARGRRPQEHSRRPRAGRRSAMARPATAGASVRPHAVRGRDGPMKPLSLSVVVPATNEPPTLDRCTAAIRAAAAPDDELVVVDGPLPANAARARNLGAARARGDVIVFVDSDVELHRDALDAIRSPLTADPDLAALFR